MPDTRPPIELRRTTRFSINPGGSTQGYNSFAGNPASIGLARFYEITLGVRGIPDADTGYLVGIQELDSLVRTHLVPMISDRCDSNPTTEPCTLLSALWSRAQSHTHHPLSLLRWHLSPYYQVEMTSNSASSNAILIRQRFEFAAAHRLHSPALSDAQNASFFGKCNNPSGHGHNYQIEPTVRIPPDALDAANTQLTIQQAVNSTLLSKLDHKFLNTDCEWFNQDQGGVIPSVENIARVCFEQLAPAIESLGHGIELLSMQAWETEKTSAIYPG